MSLKVCQRFSVALLPLSSMLHTHPVPQLGVNEDKTVKRPGTTLEIKTKRKSVETHTSLSLPNSPPRSGPFLTTVPHRASPDPALCLAISSRTLEVQPSSHKNSLELIE